MWKIQKTTTRKKQQESQKANPTAQTEDGERGIELKNGRVND